MSLRASTASKSTKGLSVSIYFASPSRRHYEGDAVRPARCRPICPTLCQFRFPAAQGISVIATQVIRVQYNVSFGDRAPFLPPFAPREVMWLESTSQNNSSRFSILSGLRHTHNRHVDPFSCVWRGSSLLPLPLRPSTVSHKSFPSP